MSALLDVRDVSRRFAVQRGPRGTTRWLHAVEDVSFDIKHAGVRGAGRRIRLRQVDPRAAHHAAARSRPRAGSGSTGKYLEEVPAARFAARPERARIQMVFQDPDRQPESALHRVHTIADPLPAARRARAAAPRSRERVRRVLADLVGLPR